MYWFKKMIEVAKAQGVRYEDGSVKRSDLAHFFDACERSYQFVFLPNKAPISSLPESDFTTPIDAPFEVISIEMFGDQPLSFGGGFADIYCVLNYEIEPGENAQYVLVKSIDGFHVFLTDKTHELVRAMVNRLGQGYEDGFESVRNRIKIGQGKNKRVHTIRKIIYIRPKKKMDRSVDLPSNHNVDFSIRFVRRGHWRELPGKLGKDRHNNYCVHGRTWVNQSKPIGPDDKPLIKKTRVVSSK